LENIKSNESRHKINNKMRINSLNVDIKIIKFISSINNNNNHNNHNNHNLNHNNNDRDII
jgi:hypothetical protein